MWISTKVTVTTFVKWEKSCVILCPTRCRIEITLSTEVFKLSSKTSVVSTEILISVFVYETTANRIAITNSFQVFQFFASIVNFIISYDIRSTKHINSFSTIPNNGMTVKANSVIAMPNFIYLCDLSVKSFEVFQVIVTFFELCYHLNLLWKYFQIGKKWTCQLKICTSRYPER